MKKYQEKIQNMQEVHNKAEEKREQEDAKILRLEVLLASSFVTSSQNQITKLSQGISHQEQNLVNLSKSFHEASPIKVHNSLPTVYK
jgi:hypothetical protein